MVESIPNQNNRMYREEVDNAGLLCIGSVQYDINILNISLNGLLAEWVYDAAITDFQDKCNALKKLPVVDIHIPDLQIAGEAYVVRVDQGKTSLKLGLEFRHLSYHIDKLLFNRRAFRHNSSSTGQITINKAEYAFHTENISVNGMIIRIIGRVDVEIGVLSQFMFKQLELKGEATVIWLDRDYNSTLLGLVFLQKSRI